MALIKCPECGKEISDKASSCLNCGYPIELLSLEGKLIWTGSSGEVAELFFDGETYVTIKYHMSMMHYGGECSGIINPSKSKKYNVSERQGIMSTKLVLLDTGKKNNLINFKIINLQ